MIECSSLKNNPSIQKAKYWGEWSLPCLLPEHASFLCAQICYFEGPFIHVNSYLSPEVVQSTNTLTTSVKTKRMVYLCIAVCRALLNLAIASLLIKSCSIPLLSYYQVANRIKNFYRRNKRLLRTSPLLCPETFDGFLCSSFGSNGHAEDSLLKLENIIIAD